MMQKEFKGIERYFPLAVEWSEMAPEFYICGGGVLHSLGKFSFRRGCDKPEPALHFIFSGRGVFEFDNISGEAGAGDMVMLDAHTPCCYHDYPAAPWHYCWFKFAGSRHRELLMRVLESRGPFFPLAITGEAMTRIKRMVSFLDTGQWHHYDLAAMAWEILSLLERVLHPSVTRGDGDMVARECRDYIDANFSMLRHLAVLERHCELDRSSIYRRFIREYGISPKQYLEKIRLETAVRMLESTVFSIKEIASLTGYSDQGAFCKKFLAVYHCSPTAYRRMQ